ncbi:MAG: hypothetical protein JWO76_2737 [Nocardioides sp.]|nr:hypothetical protein [Nocardioides sp.]
MPPADVAISVPASWRRTSDPACGVLVAAAAATLPASGFRPSVRLTCQPAPGDADAWSAQSVADLRSTREDFALEDEDGYDLGGHEVGYRRYAHRLRGTDVLCDEWAWLLDGVGLVLTCSVAREEYVDYCDVFEAIAQTVEPAA